jgi:hypothetical protein
MSSSMATDPKTMPTEEPWIEELRLKYAGIYNEHAIPLYHKLSEGGVTPERTAWLTVELTKLKERQNAEFQREFEYEKKVWATIRGGGEFTPDVIRAQEEELEAARKEKDIKQAQALAREREMKEAHAQAAREREIKEAAAREREMKLAAAREKEIQEVAARRISANTRAQPYALQQHQSYTSASIQYQPKSQSQPGVPQPQRQYSNHTQSSQSQNRTMAGWSAIKAPSSKDSKSNDANISQSSAILGRLGQAEPDRISPSLSSISMADSLARGELGLLSSIYRQVTFNEPQPGIALDWKHHVERIGRQPDACGGHAEVYRGRFVSLPQSFRSTSMPLVAIKVVRILSKQSAPEITRANKVRSGVSL